eukprot:IDg10808t1
MITSTTLRGGCAGKESGDRCEESDGAHAAGGDGHAPLAAMGADAWRRGKLWGRLMREPCRELARLVALACFTFAIKMGGVERAALQYCTAVHARCSSVGERWRDGRCTRIAQHHRVHPDRARPRAYMRGGHLYKAMRDSDANTELSIWYSSAQRAATLPLQAIPARHSPLRAAGSRGHGQRA